MGIFKRKSERQKRIEEKSDQLLEYDLDQQLAWLKKYDSKRGRNFGKRNYG